MRDEQLILLWNGWFHYFQFYLVKCLILLIPDNNYYFPLYKNVESFLFMRALLILIGNYFVNDFDAVIHRLVTTIYFSKQLITNFN